MKIIGNILTASLLSVVLSGCGTELSQESSAPTPVQKPMQNEAVKAPTPVPTPTPKPVPKVKDVIYKQDEIKYSLIDTEGKKYTALDKSVGSQADELLFHVNVNPGLSTTKLVAFETPKDKKAGKLEVFDKNQFMKDEKTYIVLNQSE